MKKLLLLFMICLSFSTGMYAKTIHWLTFIDTTDSRADALNILFVNICVVQL